MNEQKKKLRLDELKVDSFVTTMNGATAETAKGGTIGSTDIFVIIGLTLVATAIEESIKVCSKGCTPPPPPPSAYGQVSCAGGSYCGGGTGDPRPGGCQYIQ